MREFTPKTVGEQAAFEFGAQLRKHLTCQATLALIGRRYAFNHQFSVFPRSEDGYHRLLTAYNAGAKIET